MATAPEWVFPWRARKLPLFPRLLAVAIAAAAFALVLATVRVRVVALEKSSPRKASVIYLRDDAQGRALTLRAREGGPFPSRFEPSGWEGLAGLEDAALAAARFQPPPYVPAIGNLPAENPVQPLKLATAGESFWPKRPPPVARPPSLTRLRLVPVLYPLSGVATAPLPRDLPPFAAVVDGAMASAPWRFLVRLSPEGIVAECVSLEQGGEAGAPELEAWLHRVRFAAEPTTVSRWIAVSIGFTNQPVDGTDAR